MSIEYSRLLGCYGVLRIVWRGLVSSCAWLRNPRTDCLTLKMEALRSFETSITVSRHSVISLTPLRELQISLHAHCTKITPSATRRLKSSSLFSGNLEGLGLKDFEPKSIPENEVH